MFGLFYMKLLKQWESRKKKRVITRNFKDLKVRRKLSKEQKKEVQDFYMSMIGRKVDLYSHEYFYSRTGLFTKEYVPTNLYHCDLLPRANKHSLKPAYNDKNLIDILLAGENVAHTVLKNMNGYYYYEGRPVSEEEAVALCRDMEHMIIKPSKKSKGMGIRLLTVKEGVTNIDGMTVEKLFKKYSPNFLIQKVVKQHKDMAALNPSSVNTIRILSYRSGMEILIIYSVVRIGRSGSEIDNQCAGGISTTISKEGKLGKEAFGGYSEDNIVKTDTGIVLDGYQLPSYDKAIEMVKRMHLRLPFFDLVGWDVAIEEDGSPVLIEFNTDPGLSQSAFGSGMGEHTERIIRELWKKPNSWFKGC